MSSVCLNFPLFAFVKLEVLEIPKLELSVALLLSDLMSRIAKEINFAFKYHCWSDTTAQIQKRTKGMIWNHVPSQLNPAAFRITTVEKRIIFFTSRQSGLATSCASFI